MFVVLYCPRGGGGTQVFSCIHRLRSFFVGSNFEFHYFGGFSEKTIFGGTKILWIFWGVITKLDYI